MDWSSLASVSNFSPRGVIVDVFAAAVVLVPSFLISNVGGNMRRLIL